MRIALPEPPWGRRQYQREARLIHPRWIAQLTARLPEGVPATVDRPDWPVTWGDDEDGKAVHKADEGEGSCFQCGGCRFYLPIEGSLGADWGVCSNAASEYDRVAVFEHWTCKEFKR